MTLDSTGGAPQFMRALEVANRVRVARAELKVQVARGEVGAADVVLACPAEAASMPITDLLLAQRSWGPARCQRFLYALSLREDKPIGSMTERQRRLVVAQLAMGGQYERSTPPAVVYVTSPQRRPGSHISSAAR